ncbi:MAG: TonB-dependent receptor [Candidatus Latescibacteria bacterium]|nr:TonB-dependent receptor [Candidatus Latescibacterota bacterium]
MTSDKKAGVLLLWVWLMGTTVAHPAQLSGTVKDAQTQEPLIGASAQLKGTRYGTTANQAGVFAIHNLSSGRYVLRVSFIGYAAYDTTVNLDRADSLHLAILLTPLSVEAEEIVVTGTRTSRSIADVPVRVEAIPQEEVEEKLLMTPASVAMLLNESTGMRVQTTSATSSTANLRIQGLSGRYTQMLIDGIPSLGGLSAGFSLTQLPPLNLRQVEVVKGATSALYGPDAIAGVVNFLTKEPRKAPELTALLNGTTQRGFDAAAFYSQKFKKAGLTLLTSRNTQPRFDVDGDGFSDIAEYTRWTLVPKLLYDFSHTVRGGFSSGVSVEDRLGGAASAPRSAVGTDAPYLERIQSTRLQANTWLTWNVSPSRSISSRFAGMRLTRDDVYGSTPFNARQTVLYADVQYAADQGRHRWLAGAALNADAVADRTPGLLTSRGYRFHAPGVFAQDEVRLAARWILLVSGRADRHNRFGTFFTPRLSLMHRPTDALTIRLGGGTGFKAPTIFVEEAEEMGFRQVRPLQQVRAERSQSGSFDANWRGLAGPLVARLNAALYLTRLQHAVTADEDSLASDVVLLRNTTGATLARGGELSAQLTYGEMKLSVGYTYLKTSQTDRGRTEELSLNPRNTFGAVLVWESETAGMKAGLEAYWTDSQRVERNPFRQRSPAYWVTGAILEKRFGMIRLFANFENIFDTRQTRTEPIILGDPQQGRVRVLPVYAPLEGRVINGGVRVVLGH